MGRREGVALQRAKGIVIEIPVKSDGDRVVWPSEAFSYAVLAGSPFRSVTRVVFSPPMGTNQ